MAFDSNDIILQSEQLLNLLQDSLECTEYKFYNEIIAKSIKSLNEPCRLAVTGRVSAGKSSLVNVLLGEDYAKVGITETTATINIFKYGNPPSMDKPILCEYNDGTSEWVSKKDVDLLNGSSEEVIKKSESIKDLVFYVQNDILRNTILIDTPGIDSVTGSDGDAHQQLTELFLGLRNKHEKQTIELSNNADAVILLLGDVSHESDADFINKFLENRGGNSSVNTIGILSQIDLTDERIENRYKNSKDRYDRLSRYINCVVPISAGLKRFLPTVAQAKKIKSVISKVKSKELLNTLLLRSEKIYLMKNIPGIDLTLEERLQIYDKGVTPFRCFAVFCNYLYSYDVNEAISLIDGISGINDLKVILEEQFFSRSYTIKAELAIRQGLKIIWNILNCNTNSENNENNVDDADRLGENLFSIQNKLEQILSNTVSNNNYYRSLMLLGCNQELFEPNEIEELKSLFSANNSDYEQERLDYWYTEMNNSTVEIRRQIAREAYNKYTDNAFKTFQL